MTVGVMIGSGVFLLPAVLAPFGSLSFLGWMVTSAGTILIALTLGRLASRLPKVGGPYAYARDAFGDLTGFLVAWGYWISVVTATTAIAVAFAAYLGAIIPALNANVGFQATAALAIIWALTAVNIVGVSSASLAQLVMTLLKLIPLVVVVGWGLAAGSPDNIAEFNPEGRPLIPAIATCALLTMWAFAGVEAATIPAGDVIDAKRTIPRAVVFGAITVAAVYIAATAAVMALVPPGELAVSTAPFADAARGLGAWGPPLIAFGALAATAGALNGNILLSGQTPMAVALDGLLPPEVAKTNRGGAPQSALIASSVLATVLLALNYAEGLVAAFSFLIMMSTLTLLVPLAASSLAEIGYSWRRSKTWLVIASLALLYTGFAVIGSGLRPLLWGLVLLAAGAPVFYWGRRRALAAAASGGSGDA